MKKLIPVLLIFVIYSCNTEIKSKSEFKTDLVGTWKYVRTDNNQIYRNWRLIFTTDSSYYVYSYSNGGGFVENGILSKFDSLISKNRLKSKLIKLDSNNIKIIENHGFFGEYESRYEKSNHTLDLTEISTIDSIRRKAIGWWKLIKSNSTIKLPNFSGKYKTFTMEIETDGNARFYLNNCLDSIIDYSYRIRKNGIDFGRGDVTGSGTKMFFESDSTMKMIFNSHRTMINDTLELKKIYKLN